MAIFIFGFIVNLTLDELHNIATFAFDEVLVVIHDVRHQLFVHLVNNVIAQGLFDL